MMIHTLCVYMCAKRSLHLSAVVNCFCGDVLCGRFIDEMWNLLPLWKKAKKQCLISSTQHHSTDSTLNMEYVICIDGHCHEVN